MSYKIAVSGASKTDYCSPNATILAEEVGKEIALHGCVLITGATTGMPYFSARGAKQAGGISIGFSPASSEIAHVKAYKLPTDFFDVIVYTGFDYSGRNLLMTRAADAVIIICGRTGTLNEFTIAFEDKKPIGVLIGSGGTADRIRDLAKGPSRVRKKIVYDSNPKVLIEEIIELIKKEKKNLS